MKCNKCKAGMNKMIPCEKFEAENHNPQKRQKEAITSDLDGDKPEEKIEKTDSLFRSSGIKSSHKSEMKSKIEASNEDKPKGLISKESVISPSGFCLKDKIFSNFWIHTPKDSKEVKNVILVQDVKEFIRILKKDISHEIQMGIESGYIDEELWYPHKDLCHDPIDKRTGDLE